MAHINYYQNSLLFSMVNGFTVVQSSNHVEWSLV
jgi:hypothetical protein